MLSDNTSRFIVTLISPVFQDGNKWRVNGGDNTYSATVLDGDFLARVNNGERFGKGDLLDVDMRTIQNLSGSGVNLDRSIIKGIM